jgi:hypothetical protein
VTGPRPSSRVPPGVDWFSVVAGVATLIGLALTFVQARRARSAADGACRAVTETEGQLRHQALLFLAPEPRKVASKLDFAIYTATMVSWHAASWMLGATRQAEHVGWWK